MSLALVLAWKFNNAQGICTRQQKDGTFTITQWPVSLGPVPSAQQVAQWTAEYDARPPVVPQEVTPLQARRALRGAGLIDAVNAWVATQDDATREAWEYADRIERTSPLIAAAGPALGLTDAEIDQLFIAAATL